MVHATGLATLRIVLSMNPKGKSISLAVAAFVMLTVLAAWTRAGPVDFGGKPADRIVIAWKPDPIERVYGDAMMANRLVGIAAVLDGAERQKLASLSRRADRVGWPGELRVLGYLHALGDGRTKVSAIGRTPDGIVILLPVESAQADGLGGGGARGYAFMEAAFDRVLDALDIFSGPFEDVGDVGDVAVEPVGKVIGLDVQPGTSAMQSRILLDTTGIRKRIYNGTTIGQALEPTDRLITEETFFVRLPKAYSNSRPSGLLVWIDPSNAGVPPEMMAAAADAQNDILVGIADAGNTRRASDRLQLALDAAARAQGRFHIDPNRVTIVGLSGGGKIASTAVACFPDVFTGAIVVSACVAFEPVPLGDGRFVGTGYIKPSGWRWKLLQDHAIAVVTGPLDYNYNEAVNATRVLSRAGLRAKLFDYKDMAHTMPTPERFTAVLRWVESARVAAQRAGQDRADELLERYQHKYGGAPVTTQAQQRMLELIIWEGPWSTSAWRACGLLGIGPLQSQPSGGASDSP